MTNLQPLIALLAQAERQRDMALADQMKAREASTAAQAQADQLVAYRSEYERRWSAQFSREGRIELVRCYQDFMERLSQAVETQVQIARRASAQLDHAEAELRGHELRIAALGKLIGRRRAEDDRGAQRDEQRENDELAARVAWDRRAAAARTAPN